MVRNTAGLMTGSDPTRSTMTFHWGRAPDGLPRSFFPRYPDVCFRRDDTWFWPGDGERLGSNGPLLIFLLRMRRDPTGDPGFDFASEGWGAVRVSNPDHDPEDWKVEPTPAPQNPWNIVVGSPSVLAQDDWLYAFGTRDLEDGARHDVHLVRWPLESAAAGDLRSPEWWAGGVHGFVSQHALARVPPPLFGGALPETVHKTADGGFVAVLTVGFGDTTLGGAHGTRSHWPVVRRQRGLAPARI